MKMDLTASSFASLLGALVLMLALPAHGAESKPDPTAFDPVTFARGAKIWANNCARCHNMRDPKDLRDDQWKPVVTHMRLRAGLTGAESRDVLKFLQGSN